MASESGVTTSSAHITSILLPTARKASLGPLRHQCLAFLLRRRRVNQDKRVASRTTKTSVPYVLTFFCGVSAARRSLAVTSFILPASRTWLGTFGVVCSEESWPSTARFCRRAISMSSISYFEHVRVIPTCASSIFRRVRTTSSNSTSMAAFGYCYSSRRRYSSTRIASLYHSARLAAVRPRISSARSHGSRPSWRTHSACEHGVSYMFPAQGAAIME